MAHMQEIIIAEISRGCGESYDPYREVTQFWTKDGKLLGEVDLIQPEYDVVTAEWIIPAWMKTRTKGEKEL